MQQVGILIILLDVFLISNQLCEGVPICEGHFKGCCKGYFWNEDMNNCTECMNGYTGENCSFPCPFPLYGKKCRKECRCDNLTCDPASGCLPTGPMQSTASNSTQSTGITMPYMNAPQKDDKVNQNLKILIGVIGSFAFIMLCVYVYVTVVSKDLRSTDPLITGNHTEGEDNSHNKNLYENVNIFENRSHSVGSTGNVEIILRPQ